MWSLVSRDRKSSWSLEIPVQVCSGMPSAVIYSALGVFLTHLSAVSQGEYNTELDQGWPSQLFHPHRKDPHTFVRL